MYYVYFLKLSDNNVYTGFTQDLPRRVKEHRAGRTKFVSQHLPFVLFGYEAYIKKSGAIRREKFLKTSAGKELFKKQYRDVLIEPKEL